jgi:SWI/SNF-related matrix-associated actin-dependent regulator 1 of chromatin subfamily A
MKKAVRKGDILYISFTFDPATIAQVKTLTGRRWKQADKQWTAPYCLASVEKLREWGFDIIQPAVAPPVHVSIKGIPGIKRPLLPYQLACVEHIEAANGRTIIGDQQGLGKTAEKLAWAQYRQDVRPIVVACPSNAKWGYHSEAAYVLPDDHVEVIAGQYSQKKKLPDADVYVINYDILYVNETCTTCKGTKKVGDPKNRDEIKKCRKCKGTGKMTYLRPDVAAIKPMVLFIDECQYLQEPTSSRSQAIAQLAKGVDYIIPSSGTPIRHRPKNFYTILNLVRPDLFPAFFPFAIEYCGAKKGFFGWDYSGASNMDKLHNILVHHKVMIRRTKAEVLPELPKLRRVPVHIELGKKEWKDYWHADQDFLDWLHAKDPDALDAAERAEALVRINKLKQLAATLKLKQCLTWIDDFIETDEKLIVFGHHAHIIDAVKKRLGDKLCVTVAGGCTDVNKRDAETRFQACGRCGVKKDKHDIDPAACRIYKHNETLVFLGSLAAKEALTLTAASDVVFLEFWDSPKDHEQAEERCYGRVSDPHGATAWYLIAKGTIEEDILAMQERKRDVIDAVVDGRETIIESDLSNLLRGVKERC